MPVKNKYVHYNLSSKSRKSIATSKFLGVDFSNPAFEVSPNRAINLQNFIYKDGFVQKRNGNEEIYKVEPVEYIEKDFDTGVGLGYNINGVNFNGIWKFRAEDSRMHIIAHIGNLLFEIKNIDSKKDISIEPLIIEDDSEAQAIEVEGRVKNLRRMYKYENYKSFAFVGSNRLWFLGGNKFMCIRFVDGSDYPKVYPVANRFNSGDETEDTFIPTTTYNITYVDANVTPNRTLLDFPNKLSYFRKNKLLSGSGKVQTSNPTNQSYEYVLDAPLTIKNANDINKILVVIRGRNEK